MSYYKFRLRAPRAAICEGEWVRLINPELYADDLDGKASTIRLAESGICGGFYARNEGKACIFLRCFPSGRVSRFVAFHELDHHFTVGIGPSRLVEMKAGTAYQQSTRERLADVIAMAFMQKEAQHTKG